MNSIGLDFGTTYSVIAAPADGEGGDFTPKAAMLYDEDWSPFYDSLALRRADGTFAYGRLARMELGRRGITAYKGFKLLLAEEDGAVLRARGYDGAAGPDDVARGYLADLLSRYRARYGGIDRLVIGVPEIWVEDSVKQKCYGRLYDLAAGLGLAREVILLSEPTCACAYYVERYRERYGAGFEGHILIVDYGGGTLDIALCRVETAGEKPKVTVLRRSGAGANEEGVIGKAGFAFMEATVRLALAAAGLPPEESDGGDSTGALYECVYALEAVFKSLSVPDCGDERYKRLRELFQTGSLRRACGNQEPFAVLSFRHGAEINGRSVTVADEAAVTYGMVARAFQETILPVLNEQLDLILQYMDGHGIAYGFGEEGFKIQLIGGFCNFCWVQDAVRKKLGRAVVGEDRRYAGELPTADERTMAVAYGASLLANERTEYGFVSQYSLGLPARYREVEVPLWAVRKDMELVTDRIYLFKSHGDSAALIGADGIDELIYEGDHGLERIALDRQYAGALRLDAGSPGGYIMGISQDRSKIITFHWWEAADLAGLSGRLDTLEGRLARGEPVPGLGPGQRRRLNQVRKLRGAAPSV